MSESSGTPVVLLQKLGCHERRIVGGKNVSIVILYPGEANEQIQINAPLEWLGMVEGELQTLRGVRAGGADTTQETLGTGARWSSGSATNPNGSVAGKPGDLFTSTTGGPGASLWVKETGDGTKTGWTAK